MKYSKRTMYQGAKPSTFRNAAFLRKHPTKAEEIRWERLRNNQIEGVHFRRQHPFDKYVPDFYAFSVRLVIELDGKIHEEKSVKLTDDEGEVNLKLHSLYILRYTNDEVYKTVDDVVEDIRLTVVELKKMKENKCPMKSEVCLDSFGKQVEKQDSGFILHIMPHPDFQKKYVSSRSS